MYRIQSRSTKILNKVNKINLNTNRRYCSSSIPLENKITSVRGMHDYNIDDHKTKRFIIDNGRYYAEKYGFSQIETPIVEDVDLFKRAIGDDTDVVSKELFSWKQNENTLALRPEGTAGIIRSIISPSQHNFYNSSKSNQHKLFYAGEMFRHERPQKGRYRQFSQLGLEWIGESANDPMAEIQLLSIAHKFLKSLGIEFTLQINSIGKLDERNIYRTKLKEYLSNHLSELSKLSQSRIDRGSILRILDSKDIADREICENAPGILDYLGNDSSKHFNQVLDGLSSLNIPYTVNSRLVRGLDYYNDTIFEFTLDSKLLGSSQNTVLAGGRYDSLSSILGGPSMSAIGWAAGIERLCILTNRDLIPNINRPIYIIIVKENTDTDWELKKLAIKIMDELSPISNISLITSCSSNISSQLVNASKNNAIGSIIIGKEEYESNCINFKWMDSRKQEKLKSNELYKVVENLLKE